MKLQPIEDHVLIKPINEENTTKSGIILPDNKEKPRK
jgi:co-chaperonin GroES (HSP10)